MSITAQLRDQLADTAAALGADAPTLCSPWTVRDLLAHLIVRESRPDALPGIGLPVGPLQRHTEQVRASVADKGFDELLRLARRGPAPWWPTRLAALDRLINPGELAIHLEDMVRAQPGWEPSTLPPGTQETLWSVLRQGGRLLYASAPVGVVAIAPGHGRASLHRPPRGRGSVMVEGTPLELALHAFGRTGVAQVRTTGAPEDVDALAQHRRGV